MLILVIFCRSVLFYFHIRLKSVKWLLVHVILRSVKCKVLASESLSRKERSPGREFFLYMMCQCGCCFKALLKICIVFARPGGTNPQESESLPMLPIELI